MSPEAWDSSMTLGSYTKECGVRWGRGTSNGETLDVTVFTQGRLSLNQK